MRYASDKLVSVVAALAVAAIAAAAQAPTAQKPQFEVASVKPTKLRGPIDTPPGGRFIAVGNPLRTLIGFAYRVRSFQIIGGPSWVDTDLWEIQAKAEEGSVPAPQPRSRSIADAMKVDAIALMLQSLLEDRFQLKLRHETRDFPAYELVVAKGGLKMRLDEDQTPLGTGGRSTPPPRLPNGLPVLTRGMSRIGGGPRGMQFEANAIQMDLFVNTLANATNRTIIDKTGLTGLYDFKLEWAPDNLQAPVSLTADAPPAASAPTGPSLTTALEEQLGLRLVSTKAPLEVLVIDSVQKPSEN